MDLLFSLEMLLLGVSMLLFIALTTAFGMSLVILFSDGPDALADEYRRWARRWRPSRFGSN